MPCVAERVVAFDHGTEDDQDEMTGSYKFEELSDKAKDRARDDARDWNTDGIDWWDFVYEDAVRMGALMGIDIGTRTQRYVNGKSVETTDIQFSGFCSQGDGASFSGSYSCVPDAVAKIMAECNDETLIGIAEELTAAQVTAKMEHGWELAATIELNQGYYCHSGNMSCTVSGDDNDLDDDYDLLTLFRRFADWIYHQLEAEYTYQTSDEAVEERLKDDHLFDADGVII